MFEEYGAHDVAVYGGYLEKKEEVLRSTSGGIATALADYMIAQGGYVAGVAYTADFYSAEYILIHDKSQVERLRGTKYIESEKKDIYQRVKQLIDDGEKVLFFGLPCCVAALYKYLGSRPQLLITCELICHGPIDAGVHKEYVELLEKKYKAKVVDFSVRYKRKSWTPPYLHAKFDNGRVFEKPFVDTGYSYVFSVLGKESCYRCAFKGNNRQGDIMLGDFWGANEQDDFWNECGVSSIFAETERGNAFLLAAPGIKVFRTTFERAVQKNPMVVKPKARSGEKDRFIKLFNAKGLAYAIRYTPPLKKRIKRTLKKGIPVGVRARIKKRIKP